MKRISLIILAASPLLVTVSCTDSEKDTSVMEAYIYIGAYIMTDGFSDAGSD